MQPVSTPPPVFIECRHLSKHFAVSGSRFGSTQTLRAVDDVSLDVQRGEVLGLVGESGCGKSTFGRTLLSLLAPTSGDIIVEGCNLAALSEKQLYPWRRRMQIIFQDPFSSLDPRMTIEHIIAEPLVINKLARSKSDRKTLVAELLAQVGLRPEFMSRYPHEFSGGQRQRIGIARALAVKPDFIVCDEPLSALDVSVQAQIVNLLLELQEKFQIAYLFISHDLDVVRFMSRRIAVMYLGRIVEVGAADDLAQRPLHPYTRALLDSMPVPDPSRRRHLTLLTGDVPNPMSPPPGCAFHPRCPRALPGTCDRQMPELSAKGNQHKVACFNPCDAAH